ncbi:MAG: arginine--tRNA ligase [Spirochaetes bacterium]|nr:arginine--tRNA ligase [Spirochaetota bacterium]
MQLINQYINQVNQIIMDALKKLDITETDIITEIPPKRELGDLAYPLFKYAKTLKKSPVQIAEELKINIPVNGLIEKLESKGPYLNIFFNKNKVAQDLLTTIINQDIQFATSEPRNEKVVIEFSSPNTNKPLHLGHCRNNVLGDTVARLMKKIGYEVVKLNLVNDRGVHICRSMLAYDHFGNGATPQDTGKKSDHFVGDYYIKFTQEAEKNPELEKETQTMLQRWEEKDPEIRNLWKKMNHWTLEGLQETYKRMGIQFDEIQFESDTYLLGKDIIQQGLEKGVLYQKTDKSIWIDNEDVKLDKKILMRSDGTSIYITQDLGTAYKRYDKYQFSKMIYVVGSEQNYHFQTLFASLKKLGYDWVDHCYHLSYGMVNLKEGKMKSREGTVVDADNLMDTLYNLSKKIIKEKQPDWDDIEQEKVAEKVGMAALKYYLLNFSTTKDFLFIPEQSISFEGNTGPYLQYTCARLNSLLNKAGNYSKDPQYLKNYAFNFEEWQVISNLLEFEKVIEKAALTLSPIDICTYLYNLTKYFNKFYHDHPIATAKEENIRVVRLMISQAVHTVLKIGLSLMGIEALERM